MNTMLKNLFFPRMGDSTYERFYYVKVIPENAVLFFFSVIFSMRFVGISYYIIFNIIPLAFMYFIFMFVFVDWILHTLLTRDLSNKILHWKTTGLDIEHRTELLIKIQHYPRGKAREVFSLFNISNAFFTMCLGVFYHVNVNSLVLFSGTFLCFSYVYVILVMYLIEMSINRDSIEIVRQGINENRLPKKNLGNSVKTSYMLFIVIPLFGAAAISFLIVNYGFTSTIIHSNGNIACRYLSDFEKSGFFIRQMPSQASSTKRIIALAVLSILCIFYLSMLYFNRMNRYTKLMQETLIKIKSTNFSKENLFPIDFATENSYTLYLINKAITLFDSLMQKNSVTNESINRSAGELSEISRNTKENVTNQSANIDEILTTMRNVDHLSRNIAEKIEEVITVAQRTQKNVDSIFHDMNTNSSKMQEITESNRTTIENMTSLSSRINSIQDITKIIDNVAEQTKTIAFSAELEENSIENSDMSFNDVAGEIRKLSSSITDLTKEIREQIREITEASEELIETGNICMQKTREGNELSLKLESKFNEIKNFSDKTAKNSSSIKHSIHEQGESFHQIVGTLSQITSSVKSFGIATTELSSTINKLKENSSHILALNNKYRLINSIVSEGAYK